MCARNECQRLVNDVIEHVSVDCSNRQLIAIIRRNKHLILDYPQFVDKLLPCDVLTGSVYEKKRKDLQTTSNDTFPITLMLHIDSTPIVHWSKKHTWLVTASIVEIPPPLRENQVNLLLLSVWYVEVFFVYHLDLKSLNRIIVKRNLSSIIDEKQNKIALLSI